MRDLEICKRIAEIEGLEIPSLGNDKVSTLMVKAYCDDGFKSRADYFYNPLTDDALCFQLMVKHKVKSYFKNDGWVTGLINDNGEPHSFNMDESLNKAICLAIIEAHKDQS